MCKLTAQSQAQATPSPAPTVPQTCPLTGHHAEHSRRAFAESQHERQICSQALAWLQTLCDEMSLGPILPASQQAAAMFLRGPSLSPGCSLAMFGSGQSFSFPGNLPPNGTGFGTNQRGSGWEGAPCTPMGQQACMHRAASCCH